ncbi:MAG: glycosyltransferase family 39 protein [Candidatus Gastranaerophilales bacterium]|nr:glycosyltransferase family 39 protein [Candidatus Gastranaerophilales bacterium]
MYNFFKSDKGIILLLTFVFFAVLPFFYLHQGLLLIDTGREFYIPWQITKGDVLYKNIYNQYGAFSYLFNAVLLYIFGLKIKVLATVGILNSLLIIVVLYLIAREFLSKNISFLFSILIIFALVYRTFLYNSNLTYSFAIVYALSSFLVSVLFLIKYIKNGKNYMAYSACFFAGLSIANKYEFCLYPLILIYVFCFIRPLGLKNIFKAFISFLIVPVICYGFLLFQGININDVKQNIILFNNLINAPSLNLFFRKTGVFFDISYLLSLIVQNKFFAVFAIIPILNVILLISLFKKVYENKALFVLILCSIAASAKSFFYLNVNHMGVFIFPVCMLAFITLLSITEKKQQKFINLLMCFCILLFAANDFASLKHKNFLLETSKGSIYTFKKEGQIIEQVCGYISNNTKTTDKIIIMPEGSIMNYIIERNGDNYYYSLIPLLYNDVFKEERILNHFKNNYPEYFVILPINNIEYGSRFFGVDYAQNFYEMIINNYNLVEENNDIKIFKRKNL